MELAANHPSISDHFFRFQAFSLQILRLKNHLIAENIMENRLNHSN